MVLLVERFVTDIDFHEHSTIVCIPGDDRTEQRSLLYTRLVLITASDLLKLNSVKLKLNPCTNLGVFVQVYRTGVLFT